MTRLGAPSARTNATGLGLAAFNTGEWCLTAQGTGGTTTPAEGVELAVPFVLAKAGTLAQLGANITAAGAAGALVRFGVRADTGSFKPGTLLADLGTATATATGVVTSPVVSVALSAGTLYWATTTTQGAAATRPTLTSSGIGLPIVGSTSLSALLTGNVAGLLAPAGTSGALPTTQASWTNTTPSGVPRVALLAA